ncbi:hypothetical protein Tco_0776060 [Tanacetum coccineum]
MAATIDEQQKSFSPAKSATIGSVALLGLFEPDKVPQSGSSVKSRAILAHLANGAVTEQLEDFLQVYLAFVWCLLDLWMSFGSIALLDIL